MKKKCLIGVTVLTMIALLLNTVMVGSALSDDMKAGGDGHYSAFQAAQDFQGDVSLTDDGKLANEDSPVVEEDVSLRGEYEKHFIREDGSYAATSYVEPVHYRENGQWKEIDNTLEEISTKDGTRLATRDGLADVSFAKTAGGQLARIEKDGYSLSWSLCANAPAVKEISEETTEAAFDTDTEAEAGPETSSGVESASKTETASAESVSKLEPEPEIQVRQYRLNPASEAKVQDIDTISGTVGTAEKDKSVSLAAQKAGSQVLYENAFAENAFAENAFAGGIDIRYTVSPTRVKEDIILHSPKDITSYTITLQAPGLTALLGEDGTVAFLDAKDAAVFTIPPMYMYDAGDAYSEDIALSLNGADGVYTLTVTPDAEWLQSGERVYPVTIDPEYTSQVQQHIWDSSVTSAAPDTIPNLNVDRLYVGYRSGGKNYALIRHHWDHMPTVNGTITSAYEYLKLYTGTSTAQNVTAFQINQEWNPDTPTYNKVNSWSKTQLHADVPHNSLTGYNINVTNAVKLWYSTSTSGWHNNYGIMVRYANDSYTGDYNSVFSSDFATVSYRPRITINYTTGGETSGIKNDTVYYIRSVNSEKYLDVEGGTSASRNVDQWQYQGTARQQWKVSLKDGYYQFTPMINTQKRLDIYYATDSNGINVQVEVDNGTDAQKFKIIESGMSGGSKAYRIQPKISTTRVLDVNNYSWENGANVEIYTWNDTTNQKWVFEEASAVQGPTPGITSGATYYIRSVNSNKYMDVQGGTAADRNVVQWDFHGRANQQWRLDYLGGGYYQFVPVINTGKRLDIYYATDSNGTNVQVEGSNKTEAQKFKIIDSGSGTFRIQPKISTTRVLDVNNYSMENGGNVEIYTWSNTANQKWVFERANYDLINQLHQAAKNQDSSVTGSYRKMFNFMRHSDYTGTFFNETAGPVDTSFRTQTNLQNSLFSNLYTTRQVIFDPLFGEVDFSHMVLTMNALVYNSSIVVGLSLGNEDVDALAGWAGDLQSLIKQAIQNPNIYSSDSFYWRIYKMLGSKSYNFAMSDLMADIDAMYFVGNASSTLFGTTLKNYYSNNGQHKNRETFFNSKVTQDKILYYARQKTTIAAIPITWPIYSGLVGGSGSVTVTQSDASDARHAFTEKLSVCWD